MKKFLGIGTVTLLVFTTLLILTVWWFFKPYSHNVPVVPDDVVLAANDVFIEKMLQGEGMLRTRSGETLPAIDDSEPRFMNSIVSAGGGRLGINIGYDLVDVPGGYYETHGQPIDIVRGDVYEYLLYGRESNVYYLPHRNAWNDTHKWLSSDFYLVRKNVQTGEGEIVKEYTNVQSMYGSLQYEEGSGEIRVLICGVVDEYVPVTEKLQDNTEMFRLVCTGP